MTGSSRFLALMLAAVLGLAGLTACGGSQSEEPAAAPEAATETDSGSISGDDFESGDTSQWENLPPTEAESENEAQPDAGEETDEKEDPAG